MAATKSKPKAKRFKLEDFRDGAVCGMLCLEAFRDESLLEPVRQWVAEGKLVFAPGESDLLSDILYLAESLPKPEPKPVAKSAKVRPAGEKEAWPYRCGRDRRLADQQNLSDWNRTGGLGPNGKPIPRPEPTPNPCINFTGELWQAGYDGRPEPMEPSA